MKQRKMDKLIVMGNVLGIADKPNEFGSFLIVCQKFSYNCICLFHTNYPEKTIWQMIISQTKMFNIFSGSIQLSSILKIIMNNSNRETIFHISPRELCLNRLYFEISNRNEKFCFTIDCRNSNFIGRGKYRTKAEDPTTHYFNQKKNDKVFNAFLAKIIPSLNSEISFQIDNLVDTWENGEIKLFEAVTELKRFSWKKWQK